MEQEVKDWEKYSRQIVLAMSRRMAELGMTQQMLAEKINCTQQYVSKAELLIRMNRKAEARRTLDDAVRKGAIRGQLRDLYNKAK